MVVFAPSVDTLVFSSGSPSSLSTALSSWLSNDGEGEYDPGLVWYTREEFLEMRKNALLEDSESQGGRFLSGSTAAYLKEEQRRWRIARVVYAVLDEQRKAPLEERADRLAQVSSQLSQTARDDARNRAKKEQASLRSEETPTELTEQIVVASTSKESGMKPTGGKSLASSRSRLSLPPSTSTLAKRSSSSLSRYHRPQGLWNVLRSVVSNRGGAALPVLCFVLTLAAMQKPQTRASE